MVPGPDLTCSICHSEFIEELNEEIEEEISPQTDLNFLFGGNPGIPEMQQTAFVFNPLTGFSVLGRGSQPNQTQGEPLPPTDPNLFFQQLFNIQSNPSGEDRNEALQSLVNQIQQALTQGIGNMGDYASEDLTDLIERFMEEGGNKPIGCSEEAIRNLKRVRFSAFNQPGKFIINVQNTRSALFVKKTLNHSK